MDKAGNYQILAAIELETLEGQVNDSILKGYKPQGDLLYEKETVQCWMQAMVKEKNETTAETKSERDIDYRRGVNADGSF